MMTIFNALTLILMENFVSLVKSARNLGFVFGILQTKNVSHVLILRSSKE